MCVCVCSAGRAAANGVNLFSFCSRTFPYLITYLARVLLSRATSGAVAAEEAPVAAVPKSAFRTGNDDLRCHNLGDHMPKRVGAAAAAL